MGRKFDKDAMRAAREAEGLTMAELADRVEVSESAAYHWERGVRVPRPDKLGVLADTLGVSLDDLFI